MADPQVQRSGERVLVSIGLFALGFLAAATVIHLTIRDPLHLHADERSEKLLLIDRTQGSVYSAAFGSSHVHNGFDPRAFDRELAASPAATRSVNLAIEGGSQSEERAMAMAFVKSLKAPPAPAPCLVMLELAAGANPTNDHLVHPRSIDIYDWPTARFVSHLVEPHMSATRRIGRVGFAVTAMALHYANTGMLSNLIFSPPIDKAAYEYETEDDRRGIKPLRLVDATAEDRRYLEAALAQRNLSKPPEKVELTLGNSELIAQLTAAAPGRNLSFVYLIMPMAGDAIEMHQYPDHLIVGDKTVPIIQLGRPDLYPELYQAGLWHDNAHLDGDGAAIASALFADRLKEWYEQNGEPHACAK